MNDPHDDPKIDDPALDAAREWLALEPPGARRADALPVPRLARPRARVVRLRPAAWRAAAAAALVAVGFFAGRASSVLDPEPAVNTARPAILQPVPQPVRHEPATSPANTEPLVPQSADTRVAAHSMRRVTDDNGRLIIETTLAGSGAHATFIVDGNFRLASATEE